MKVLASAAAGCRQPLTANAAVPTFPAGDPAEALPANHSRHWCANWLSLTQHWPLTLTLPLPRVTVREKAKGTSAAATTPAVQQLHQPPLGAWPDGDTGNLAGGSTSWDPWGPVEPEGRSKLHPAGDAGARQAHPVRVCCGLTTKTVRHTRPAGPERGLAACGV